MRGKTNAEKVHKLEHCWDNYKLYYTADSSHTAFPTLNITKPTRFLSVQTALGGSNACARVTVTSGNDNIPIGFDVASLQYILPIFEVELSPGDKIVNNLIQNISSGKVQYYVSELQDSSTYKELPHFTLKESGTLPTKFTTIVATKDTRVIMRDTISGTQGRLAWHVETSDGNTYNFEHRLTTAGASIFFWQWVLHAGDKLVCDTSVAGTSANYNNFSLYTDA